MVFIAFDRYQRLDAGGLWGREALARALPGRPWPNLRGDGLDAGLGA